MAINERLIDTEVAAAGNGDGGNAGEEGLILHLDANDVDSYDGDGAEWVDIKDHEYTPATNVSEHFNTVTYTGTGATNFITGVGFQPDLIWIKDRTAIEHHYLMDSVRGKNGGIVFENLYSSLTNAQANDNSLTSLDEDGFTLQASGNGNVSGESNVAWCFKAGGAAVSNTDGTITSQVSANNDLGFSIVSYTGAASGTVGHGLGVPPELIITKQTVSTGVWATYSKTLGTDKLLELNSNSGAQSVSNYWGTSAPTSTVYGLSTNSAHYNANGAQIAYCFASRRGVSKVGSYTGTGANNKVYTGFEPAFIIGKCSSNDVTNWWIFDNKREDKVLYPNLFNSEDTLSDYVSFDRDGFTLSNAAFVNQSGRNFIYYAVAKNTNETSLIPDTDLELHLDADSFPQKNEAGYSNTPSTWTALTGSNGTITGATFDSELGNWLDFERDSSHTVTIADSSSLDISTNITLEAWINPESNTSYGRLFWKSGAYALYLGTNGWTFLLGATSLNHNINIPSTGTWYHIAATYDGSNQKLYINGELLDTEAMTGGIPTNNNPLYIGGIDSARFFDGKIGQVRIYSSALTQDQIRQNYNFTKPSYPNGNDGTINGAVWNPDGYFDFGSGRDVNLGAANKFELSQITFRFKIRVDGTSAQECILAEYTGGALTLGEFRITREVGEKITVGMSSGSPYLFIGTTAAILTTSFKTITVVVDTNLTNADKIKIYDGDSLVSSSILGSSGTIPLGGSVLTRSSNLYLGKRDISSSPQNLNGDIANFKIYDKALTQAEITALYNEG